jgi:hypothetical protein
MKKITNLSIKIPSESDNINNLKYPKITIKKIDDIRKNKHNFTWNDVNINVNKNLCMKVINKVKTSCVIM